jgi:hypothetical protein
MNGGFAARKIIIDQPEQSVDQLESAKNLDLLFQFFPDKMLCIQALDFFRLAQDTNRIGA